MGLIVALLRKGADVNAVNNNGVTPIMLTRDPMIIRLLLSYGAEEKLGDGDEDEYKNFLWERIVKEQSLKTRGLAFLRGRETGLHHR
jgi:ankyrin repeat protein